MDHPFDALRRRRRRQRWRVLLYAVLLAVAMAWAVSFFRKRGRPEKPADPAIAGNSLRILELSRVFKIAAGEDAGRSLWFAGAEGVQVFTPALNTWRRFGPDHGLPSERIYDLCFFSGIPITAGEGGCARWNPKQKRFEPILLEGAANPGAVETIESIPGVGVYFALEGGELYHVQDVALPAVRVPGPAGEERLKTVTLKVEGRVLYVGTSDGGLYACHPPEHRWKRFVFGNTLSDRTRINDVLIHAGILWVATSDAGVWKADSGADTLRFEEDFPARGAFVFEEERDGFWCGTPFGLWRHHDRGKVWIRFLNPGETRPDDFQVFSLFAAADRVYFGSGGLGSGYLTRGKVRWFTFHGVLGRANACALAARDSLLWAGYGYQGGFMDQLLGGDMQPLKSFDGVDGILEPHVQALTAHGTKVYYGGFSGFGYVDLTTSLASHFGPREGEFLRDIAQVTVAEKPPFYLAGLFGVVQFFPGNDSFAHLAPTRNVRVTAVLPDGDSLWLGTLSKGVRIVDRSSGHEIASFESITSRVVGLFAVPAAGLDVFAAAQQEGLFHINKRNGAMTAIPIPGDIVRDPTLERAHCFAMAAIGETLWLGTRGAGCLIYSPKTNHWFRLNSGDGLASDQVRSFCDNDRYLWVGSYGGIARFEKVFLAKKWGVSL